MYVVRVGEPAQRGQAGLGEITTILIQRNNNKKNKKKQRRKKKKIFFVEQHNKQECCAVIKKFNKKKMSKRGEGLAWLGIRHTAPFSQSFSAR